MKRTSDSFEALREEAWEANQALPRSGLVVHTFGNVSVFDRALGVFAIKPSGVPYDALLATDMVIVDLDARVVSGTMRPSSDTRTHAELYRNFACAGAIAHTHSTHAVAWAQALRDIPLYGTTHADLAGVGIPCTAHLEDGLVAGDYEAETGRQIVREFERRGLDPGDCPMVLVGGHGPFTWGATGRLAVYHSVMLEEVARMAWLTEALAPGASPLPEALASKHFGRKHGGGAYYGQ